MTIRRLVLREIAYRKLNFLLTAMGVVIAAGALVATATLLRSHDVTTEQIMAQRQQATEKAMLKLKDDYRKIGKLLGFNLLILPKNQKLADLYAEDYASSTMPESYVDTLAQSSIMSVNHLLPTLQQKLVWPETGRTVLLMGTRGEVPILHRDPKKPLLQAVEPGYVVVGHELHTSLKLKKGDRITLKGKSFEVSQCLDQRGSKDDITLWIDLGQLQMLLDKRGLVNGVLALSCHCSGSQLPKIRKEIARILPDTQVIEFHSLAVTRAEARSRAAKMAKDEEQAVLATRNNLRGQRERFAGILVPAVLAAGMVWVGLMTLLNVRSRRGEIGVLRTVGVRSRQLLGVFLGKAILIGFGGACFGYPLGFFIGNVLGKHTVNPSALFDAGLLVGLLVGTPILTVIASWLPAVMAAQQDPASILRED